MPAGPRRARTSARGHQPSGRSHPPTDHIALAEEAGLIGALGHQVLEAACAALVSWRPANGADDLTVAVNVSAAQLEDPNFPDEVATVAASHGVAPATLCLEVTESMLIDATTADRALRRLKAAGFEIAVDDFGTGYSSLNRLHRFPVD